MFKQERNEIFVKHLNYQYSLLGLTGTLSSNLIFPPTVYNQRIITGKFLGTHDYMLAYIIGLYNDYSWLIFRGGTFQICTYSND